MGAKFCFSFCCCCFSSNIQIAESHNLTTEDIFPVNVDELVPVRSGVLVEKSQRMHDFMDNCSNPHAAITNGNHLLATLGFASNS